MAAATVAPPVLDYEAPAGEPMFDSLEAAAKYIQRRYRGRKIRKLLAMFPSLEQLREIYLDPKARMAGAADSKWYTSQALKAREHVRLSAEVDENCNTAYDAIMEASRHWAETEAVEAALKQGMPPDSIAAAGEAAVSALAKGLTKDAYAIMARKLYLMSKLHEDDIDFDTRDMLESAEEDWADDSGGRPVMDKEAFKRCWFQLVDLHTEHINAEDYVEWADDTLETITRVDPETGGRIWREDAELLERFGPRASASEQSAFDARRRHWTSTFKAMKSAATVMRATTLLRAAGAARGGAGGAPLGGGAENAPLSGAARRASLPRAAEGMVSPSGRVSPAFAAGGTPINARRISGQLGLARQYYSAGEYVDPIRQVSRPASAGLSSAEGPAAAPSGRVTPSHPRPRPDSAARLVARVPMALAAGTRLGLADAVTIHDSGRRTPSGALPNGVFPNPKGGVGHLRHYAADGALASSTVGAALQRRDHQRMMRRREARRGPRSLEEARRVYYLAEFSDAARPSTAASVAALAAAPPTPEELQALAPMTPCCSWVSTPAVAAKPTAVPAEFRRKLSPSAQHLAAANANLASSLRHSEASAGTLPSSPPPTLLEATLGAYYGANVEGGAPTSLTKPTAVFPPPPTHSPAGSRPDSPTFDWLASPPSQWTAASNTRSRPSIQYQQTHALATPSASPAMRRSASAVSIRGHPTSSLPSEFIQFRADTPTSPRVAALQRAAVGSPFPPSAKTNRLATLRHGVSVGASSRPSSGMRRTLSKPNLVGGAEGIFSTRSVSLSAGGTTANKFQ